MTDLTEQWKKGELELDKNYYIELEDGTIEIQMFVGGFLCKEDNGVKEVLAPVPSYEEWKEKNEENAQLKELLKECKERLIYCTISTHDVQEKINQALGEDE